VAKQAHIHSYRILDCSGEGTLGDLASGLLAVDSNYVAPAIINLSLAYTGTDTTINAVIALLLADNVTIMAAAGNNGASSCTQPATISGVFSVGATNILDQVTSYSDYGSCVDVYVSRR
jgi:hypothetical protein